MYILFNYYFINKGTKKMLSQNIRKKIKNILKKTKTEKEIFN